MKSTKRLNPTQNQILISIEISEIIKVFVISTIEASIHTVDISIFEKSVLFF